MNKYWKQILSVFSGTVIAQIIPIIGSLLITRIFSPASFGEFSTWLAILSILSIVLTLRLETTFVITPNQRQREEAVFLTSLIINIISVFLVILAIILSFLSIASYSPLFTITVIVGAWLSTYNLVWQSWMIADGKYSDLIKVRIVQSFSILIWQIIFGLYQPTMLNLSLGFIIGHITTFTFAYKKSPFSIPIKQYSINDLNSFIQRYKKFVIFGLPANVLNTLVSQLPIIIISYRFGTEMAGFLALTYRVIGMPIKLVSNAILDVFKRQASQDYLHTGNCKKVYMQTFAALLIASICLVFGTILLSKSIFTFVYGPNWEFSGTLAVWLLPLFALSFIASPLSYLIYIVEKQQIDLLWQLALFIITMINLFIFTTFQKTIVYYAISYAFLYLIYIGISYKLSLGNNTMMVKYCEK